MKLRLLGKIMSFAAVGVVVVLAARSPAFANPYLGSCETQYDATYKLMMARQSGVPMPTIVHRVESQKPEDYDILTDSELTLFYEAKDETMRIVERVYTVPSFGFMESAAHAMATEVANQQYIRCMRAKRR